MLIGTHTGEDDEILLPALEGIHTGDLHFLKETVSHQAQSRPLLSYLFLQLHRRSCITEYSTTRSPKSAVTAYRPITGKQRLRVLRGATPNTKLTRALHLSCAQDQVLSSH